MLTNSLCWLVGRSNFELVEWVLSCSRRLLKVGGNKRCELKMGKPQSRRMEWAQSCTNDQQIAAIRTLIFPSSLRQLISSKFLNLRVKKSRFKGNCIGWLFPTVIGLVLLVEWKERQQKMTRVGCHRNSGKIASIFQNWFDRRGSVWWILAKYTGRNSGYHDGIYL